MSSRSAHIPMALYSESFISFLELRENILATGLLLKVTVAVPIFFFSSRRRHTMSYGDWSSDVCSSDLWGRRCGSTPRPGPGTRRSYRHRRSEERRVGKEGRSRGSQNHYKKNIDLQP